MDFIIEDDSTNPQGWISLKEVPARKNQIGAQRSGFDLERRSSGVSARRLLKQSIKSRRKRYKACDDVVETEGFDLPCAAGHLGLKRAPGTFLRALGFESPFLSI